jgi:hypothetical protein
MTGNQMVFYYARHQITYSHDINSYYRQFVLKTLGKTVVSLIDALPELRKIRLPCQKFNKDFVLTLIKVHVYISKNLLLTWIHCVLFVAMLVYC